MGTAKTMTIKRPQRRTKRSAHGQVREGAQAPLVPAKAGTQLLLDSRLRGNERRNRGLSEDRATDAGDLNGSALYRLMAWLSPAYPIGAFSYSSGIEWAVEAGDITDAVSLKRWLAVMIADGSGFCDAVFFAHAYRAVTQSDEGALRAVAELAAAFAPSKERHLETTAQGRAFLEATRAAWPTPPLDCLLANSNGGVALPVALGVASAGHRIALAPALRAYLQAFAANLVFVRARGDVRNRCGAVLCLRALPLSNRSHSSAAGHRRAAGAPPRPRAHSAGNDSAGGLCICEAAAR